MTTPRDDTLITDLAAAAAREVPASPPPLLDDDAYLIVEIVNEWRRHTFMTTSTCVCGFSPVVTRDWDVHRARLALDVTRRHRGEEAT